MDHDFWHGAWRESQIGFHQAQTNERLIEYWNTLGLGPGDPVLVPLCGKSLDMWWLKEHGHPVIGVELSSIAVRDFFGEAGLEPAVSRVGPYEASEAGGVRIFQGDFFDLRAEDLRDVSAVFDRAALIALPPNLRLAYARSMTEKLPRAVRMLLIVIEARPSSTGGPPFSVEENEVRTLYEPSFDVRVLDRSPFAEAPPHLRARGHETIANITYLISR